MKNLLTILLGFVLLSACSGDAVVENKYSGYTARFSFSPVNAVPTLYRACNSLGDFCMIDMPIGGANQIRFRGFSSTDYYAKTAIQGYQSFLLGIGGVIIIGLPNMAEPGAMQSTVTCYDGCCSSCYRQSNITKPLELDEFGIVNCPSCHRKYDMNNQGMVIEGEKGHSLFRYAVSYNGTVVTVSNN